MRILVTGGCGFIGSHITDALVQSGHQVAVVDNLSTGNIHNLNPNAEFFHMDITSADLKNAFAQYKPEVVFHEAAQIDIQRSIKDTAFDAKVNILGTVNVLECCRDEEVQKVIYASSAAVYGNPMYLGVDEKHPADPISFYGISKYAPEYYIKVFSHLTGLEYTILRYANVYGIRQDPKGEGGVVSIFLDKMLKNEPVTIFGDGEQTRDFIYVKDIASANVAALDKGSGRTINIGTGQATSVNELYQAMQELSGATGMPTYAQERPGDILHSYFNIAEAGAALDWKPGFTLRQGLQETVAYYQNHK